MQRGHNEGEEITLRSIRQKAPLGHRWLIFSVLSVGYLFVYFHRVSCAVVASDLMQAFHTRGTALGILASAYFYPYTIMQLPVGMLADSLGPRKTVTVFLLVAGLGATLFGLSQSIFCAILSRILVGLGVAAIFVPALKILSEWFGKKEFAFMVGIMTAVGGIGWRAAATPLALLSDWLGWRVTFIGIGAVTLILAILSWGVVRNKPEDMGFTSVSDAATPKVHGQGSFLSGLRIVLFEKYFWPLAVRSFFNYGTVMGFGGLWGGPYLIDVYGLSNTKAANILMMIPVGMILGSPFLGWLSDKVIGGRKPVMVSGMFVYCLIWLPLIFWTAELNTAILCFLAFLVGLTGCSLVVINFTAVKELFPKEMAGTSTGMANVFPFAGGALFPPIMGYIMDSAASPAYIYSAAAYRAIFIFCLICAAISFLAVCFMKETLRPDEGLC